MPLAKFVLFKLLGLALAFVACSLSPCHAQEEVSTPKIQLPSKENFKIVVLAGQSNMAGRGFIEKEDRIPIPRVYMLDRSGNWVPAVDPVHYDKPTAGVGPGREFARLLVETNPDISVGLVPTACGGSSIDDWKPNVFFEQTNSYPYDDAITRTKRALEDGVLEVILWRQGESDATDVRAPLYEEKLLQLISRLRKELDAPNVPVLIGELAFPDRSDATRTIQAAQISVVNQSQPAAFVAADGVVLNPDKVHFDRNSQIEQGKRFFNAFDKLINENKK